MPRKVKLPTKWNKVRAGEWIQPATKGYLMQCCDCGLVHSMDFRVVKGHIQLRAFRVEAKR